ncbi:MAG TPA: citrate transporter, partial [Thermodesulfatator atlanticus]|nr:citrate transporter [Thermodesulfatator atlanticus]
MMKRGLWLFILGFCLLLGGNAWASGKMESSTDNLTRLNLFGRILNPHKKGVPDAEIKIFVDGQEIEPPTHGHAPHGSGLTTEFNGSFQVELELPRETIKNGEIKLVIFKPSYKKETLVLKPEDFAVKNGEYYAKVEIIIPRTKGPAFWIATVVFVLAYVLISFELLHRTLAAMLGASVMLLISYTLGTWNPEYHILSYKSAIHSIDMNVIFLLMGMMIIVGILKNTGVFQWCAYKCYQLARGNVILLSIILMTFTAVSSAFLDNVTTMLLLT